MTVASGSAIAGFTARKHPAKLAFTRARGSRCAFAKIGDRSHVPTEYGGRALFGRSLPCVENMNLQQLPAKIDYEQKQQGGSEAIDPS